MNEIAPEQTTFIISTNYYFMIFTVKKQISILEADNW